MRTIPRWNRLLHKYVDIRIPDDWYVSAFEKDMNKIVNCANCGKEITFGSGYTSQEYQETMFGFGYTVCGKCSEEETKRRLKYDRSE